MKNKAITIERVILQNISNPNFGVSMLAEIVNTSPSYLREVVYHFFSMSPQKLIESIKLQRALFMISDGASLHIIKKKLGFTNSRTLRRIFNKRLNASPKIYRDLLNNANVQKGTFLKNSLFKIWEIEDR